MSRILTVLVAIAVAAVNPPPPPSLPDVTGTVLSSSGAAVAGGTVSLEARMSRLAARTVSLEPTGSFRIDRVGGGMYELRVGAPGFATRTLQLLIPPVSAPVLRLPPIHLTAASYLRLRLVPRDADAIVQPRIVGSSFDVSGRPLGDRAGEWTTTVGADGTTRIGPLPRGVAVLALDTPPFARTRLPDVLVTGERELIDGGVVVVGRGASLRVTVTDRTGRALSGQEVRLDDGSRFSPLQWPVLTTDFEGRVTFDRLAAGRYRLRAGRSVGRDCLEPMRAVAREVRVPATGVVTTIVVIGGVDARVQLTSAGVPLAGTRVWLKHLGPALATTSWLREDAEVALPSHVFEREPMACPAVTDADGRATFPNTPPGTAELMVGFTHSTWTRVIQVPVRTRELRVAIPPGAVALRVVEATADGTARVPPRAAATWSSRRGRVEGMASPAGDILLEGVGGEPGQLSVRARGYRPVSLPRVAPSEAVAEIALDPLPRRAVRLKVTTATGQAVAGAAVMLTPADPMQDARIVIAEPTGEVSFSGMSAAFVLVVAAAEGFQPSAPVPVDLEGTSRRTVEIVLEAASAPAEDSGRPSADRYRMRGSTGRAKS